MIQYSLSELALNEAARHHFADLDYVMSVLLPVIDTQFVCSRIESKGPIHELGQSRELAAKRHEEQLSVVALNSEMEGVVGTSLLSSK